MTTLTGDRLDGLRARLMRRLDALRGAIAEEVATEAKQRYRDIVGEVGDSGDEAVGAELAAMENALIGRHMQEVRDIEAALARMVVGVYDVCIDCDAEIDHHRLAAYPTCKRCAKCQALREKTFAGKGRTSLCPPTLSRFVAAIAICVPAYGAVREAEDNRPDLM